MEMKMFRRKISLRHYYPSQKKVSGKKVVLVSFQSLFSRGDLLWSFFFSWKKLCGNCETATEGEIFFICQECNGQFSMRSKCLKSSALSHPHSLLAYEYMQFCDYARGLRAMSRQPGITPNEVYDIELWISETRSANAK